MITVYYCSDRKIRLDVVKALQEAYELIGHKV